jgi:hypothetical protein
MVETASTVRDKVGTESRTPAWKAVIILPLSICKTLKQQQACPLPNPSCALMAYIRHFVSYRTKQHLQLMQCQKLSTNQQTCYRDPAGDKVEMKEKEALSQGLHNTKPPLAHGIAPWDHCWHGVYRYTAVTRGNCSPARLSLGSIRTSLLLPERRLSTIPMGSAPPTDQSVSCNVSPLTPVKSVYWIPLNCQLQTRTQRSWRTNCRRRVRFYRTVLFKQHHGKSQLNTKTHAWFIRKNDSSVVLQVSLVFVVG